jgi:hypothetical protein
MLMVVVVMLVCACVWGENTTRQSKARQDKAAKDKDKATQDKEKPTHPAPNP